MNYKQFTGQLYEEKITMKTANKKTKKQVKYTQLTVAGSRRLDRATAAWERAKASGDPRQIGPAEVTRLIAYGAMYHCQRIRAGMWRVCHIGDPREVPFVLHHLRPRDEARLREQAAFCMNLSAAQLAKISRN